MAQVLRLTLKLVGIWLVFISSQAQAWKMEASDINLPATTNVRDYFNYNFQQSYATPPVVFIIPDQSGGNPSMVRVTDVTTTGFKAAQLEPIDQDGPHASMRVHYLAVDVGSHTLPDGQTLIAGRQTLDKTDVQVGPGDKKAKTGWDKLNFSPHFSGAPVFIAQLQTDNNETEADVPHESPVPWLTVAIKDLKKSSVDLALERSEVDDDPSRAIVDFGKLSGDETVGYVVLEAGLQGSFRALSGTINYQSILTDARFDGWSNGCDIQGFSITTTKPMVFAAMTDRTESDGGWLRRCNLTTSRVGFSIDEDQSGDTERNHGQESASILLFSDSFSYDSDTPIPTLSESFKLEADQVSLDPSRFTTVSFKQRYDAPPAVFVLGDTGNIDPSSVRIRNVTTSGFEVVPVEAPLRSGLVDGPDTVTTIDYLVVEPGLHRFPDGTLLEVGVLPVSAIQAKSGSTGWFRLNFNTLFPSTPALLTQIQTMANEAGHVPGSASVPWMTAVVDNLNSARADLALERSESNAGTISTVEQVAYLAVENRSIADFRDINGKLIRSEGLLTGDRFTGWVSNPASCVSEAFNNSYASSPLVIGNKTTRDGGDGGWLRRCLTTSNSVGLMVDEDMASDTDRAHTTEQAGLMAFSGPFVADFSLVASYLFDNCDLAGEGIAPDYSGNDLHAIPQNGAETTSGRVCKAALLDGVDDYLSVPDDDRLDDTEQLTTMMWMNATEIAQTGGSNARGLFAKRNSPSSLYAYGAFFLNGSNKLWVDIDGTNNRFSSTASFGGNIWYHVALTFDGTQPSNQRVKLYINGVLDGTYTESSSRIPNYSSDLHIGNLFNGTELKTFNGVVDEFKIFRRALSLDEIQNHMGQARTCAFCGPSAIEVLTASAASTCVAFDVTLKVLDSGGVPDTGYTGTVDLNTSSGQGNWQIGTGLGSLSPDPHTTDNGVAQYSFAAGDNGTVTLKLSNAHADRLTVTVTESAGSLTDTSELVSFSDNQIVICEPGSSYVDCSNNSPLPSPSYDLVAGRDHLLRAELWQKDATTGLCSIASGYNNKNFKAWLTRILGDAGGVAPQLLGMNTPALPNSQPATNNLQLNFVNGQTSFLWRSSDVGFYHLNLLDDSSGFAQDNSGNPLPISGSSVDWSVRPFGFYLSALGNMALIGSASEPVYRKAGAGFDIRVTAVQWQGADDLDGDGHPDGHADTNPANNADLSDNTPTPAFGDEGETATLSAYLLIPAGGNDPGLSGVAGASGFVGGMTTATGASYTEVGMIELSTGLTSGSYQGSGINLNGRSGYVGRFVPARLAVIANLPVVADQCSGFSYMDTDLDFAVPPALTLTAQNSVGGETKNYNNDFWRLGSLLGARSYSNAASTALSNFSYAKGTTASVWTGVTAFDGIGSLTLANDRVRYGRNALQGPFDALIDLLLPETDLTDADGVCYLLDTNGDGNYLDETVCEPYSITNIGGTELQFGRLRVENAFGPETEALNVMAQVEFFNGGGFVRNLQDNCSPIALDILDPLLGRVASGAGISVGTAVSTVQINAPTVDLGDVALNFSAPGLGQSGEITFQLSDSGNPASSGIGSLPWLLFDWDDDGNFDDDPGPRKASFGRYRGHDKMIFWQENYSR